MANWSFTTSNLAIAAVADTTAFTANTFTVIQGGTGTQEIRLYEISMGGLGTGSAANGMQVIVARDSTVCAATVSGGHFASLAPATAALATNPVTGQTTSGTFGQRSSTLYLLVPAFSSNGGIYRWVCAPGSELIVLGSSASFGEISTTLASGSNTGSISQHILLYPM